MNDEDLRTLLKLRRNRMRIDTLNQDLLEDEIEALENPEVNDEIIENLKMINNLLDNVRAGLAEV